MGSPFMTMVESGTDSRRNSFHDQIRLGAGGKGKGEREGRRKGPSRNGSRRSSVSVQRKEEEQEPNASGNVGGPKGDPAFGGLDQGTFNRVKNATKLEDAAVIGRFHEFMKQFPSGGISVEAFNNLSSHVLKDDEVEDFTKNVFKMFDADLNGYLTFEEFTLATECHEVANSNPLEKLSWLFENVYDKDKSGQITKDELEDILIDVLLEEKWKFSLAREVVRSIFEGLDMNKDGGISRREFLIATTQSDDLKKLLCRCALEEQKKRGIISPADAIAAMCAGELVKDENGEEGGRKKKKKKKKK